jgi:hypothetical protein
MFYSRALARRISRVRSVSLVPVLCHSYLAFSRGQHSYNGSRPGTKPPANHHRNTITHSQFAFTCYAVFVHDAALIFPFRLCWSTASLTRNLRKALKQHTLPQHRSYHSAKTECRHDLNGPILNELESKASGEDILHAIIFPNYKEDIDTLREALDILACHPQAAHHIM